MKRKNSHFVLLFGVFVLFFTGCATYFGKPSTPVNDRVELLIPDVLQLVNFDEQVFVYKLHGVITFEEGRHRLLVRYVSERTRGYYEPAGESGEADVTFDFQKGRKYVLDYNLRWEGTRRTISFQIVPAEDYVPPIMPSGSS